MIKEVCRRVIYGALFFSALLHPGNIICEDIFEVKQSINLERVISEKYNKNKTLNELTEPEQKEDEWPDYMEWMVDLKDRVYDFKITINSLSNNISKGYTQYFYLNPDKIADEKKVELIIYKHKF